ncbi:hypothetical protein [Paraburkholderia caballeronis]|uniref:hypothetical protein n=1 Tax=Paraburkholderia caballeronis TaxID=416943 RepID=UPI0010649B91|nr:hypothetical protein [Paraburkholderia caballeronis]TDV04666.1 hypothetical protein C7408_13128 [Paraburkholderia caballeronis]TDV07909.1 hypothetical protein C7406_13328 [Paraburkholderia caballeronis]TDV18200.1 hypothetical protein C7404_13128 [Paraburkholderia caballeronis]
MSKKQWVEWTTGELRILREIWASSEPLKTNVHRLPRHTLRSILFKGRREGLPPRYTVKSAYSPAFGVLKQELQRASNHVHGLAANTGVSYRRAHEFARVMHADGKIHITGWRKTERNGPAAPIYAWGEGDDVPRPEPARVRERLPRKTDASRNPFGQIIDYARQQQREAA